jgi:hypothetical protein
MTFQSMSKKKDLRHFYRIDFVLNSLAVPEFFVNLRAKFENCFSLRAAPFKIVSDDKFTIFAKQKKLVFFMLLLTVFDQISGSRRSMLLYLLPEEGPRAAKIRWKAALWPCLI